MTNPQRFRNPCLTFTNLLGRLVRFAAGREQRLVCGQAVPLRLGLNAPDHQQGMQCSAYVVYTSLNRRKDPRFNLFPCPASAPVKGRAMSGWVRIQGLRLRVASVSTLHPLKMASVRHVLTFICSAPANTFLQLKVKL